MKRDPSYAPIEGQLNVFEVLELVAEEGLVPGTDRPEEERRELDDRLRPTIEEVAMAPDDGFEIERGANYTFWVSCHGERLHIDPFWSQIECWAFIIGWRSCAGRRQL